MVLWKQQSISPQFPQNAKRKTSAYANYNLQIEKQMISLNTHNAH